MVNCSIVEIVNPGKEAGKPFQGVFEIRRGGSMPCIVPVFYQSIDNRVAQNDSPRPDPSLRAKNSQFFDVFVGDRVDRAHSVVKQGVSA